LGADYSSCRVSGPGCPRSPSGAGTPCFAEAADPDYVKHVSDVISNSWPQNDDAAEWAQRVRERLN
jgi:hypothetical protein